MVAGERSRKGRVGEELEVDHRMEVRRNCAVEEVAMGMNSKKTLHESEIGRPHRPHPMMRP